MDPHDNHLDVCHAAVVSKRWQGEWGGVECKLYIVIIIQFWDFTWYSVIYISLQINTLLRYTVVSVLVLGIGITSSQYYWILDTGRLAWYCSNPTLFGACQENVVKSNRHANLSQVLCLANIRPKSYSYGALPIHLFRHFCCSTYRLATVHSTTDKQTDRQHNHANSRSANVTIWHFVMWSLDMRTTSFFLFSPHVVYFFLLSGGRGGHPYFDYDDTY